MLELGSSEHGICPGKCYQVHLFLNKSISCQQHQRLLHLYRHINILFHELGSSEHGICPGKCYQVHLFLNKSISCQQHQRLLHLYRHINILFHIHPAHSICNLQTPQGKLPTMATLDQYSDHCLKLLKTCGIDVWICGKLHVPNPHFYIPTLWLQLKTCGLQGNNNSNKGNILT